MIIEFINLGSQKDPTFEGSVPKGSLPKGSVPKGSLPKGQSAFKVNQVKIGITKKSSGLHPLKNLNITIKQFKKTNVFKHMIY